MPVRAVLTDIEGTTSSISFVKDVLFPYARRAMPAFVRDHGNEPDVRRWLDTVAAEQPNAVGDEALAGVLQRWIDEDRKHVALKALQGRIWNIGYRDGEFTAHIYPDAADALREWKAAGHDLHVYSSGSVAAQQLFFGHSDAGDLRGLFSGWYDTEMGGKREAASYERIAHSIGQPTGDILFLSDVVEELDAAREAGLQTLLVDRREDYPQPRNDGAAHGHRRVERFDETGV